MMQKHRDNWSETFGAHGLLADSYAVTMGSTYALCMWVTVVYIVLVEPLALGSEPVPET